MALVAEMAPNLHGLHGGLFVPKIGWRAALRDHRVSILRSTLAQFQEVGSKGPPFAPDVRALCICGPDGAPAFAEKNNPFVFAWRSHRRNLASRRFNCSLVF